MGGGRGPAPAPRLPAARNVLAAAPQAAPSWESEAPGRALTVLLGYGLQIGVSNGLSRKRSLAMTKRPASTQRRLRRLAARHSAFYGGSTGQRGEGPGRVRALWPQERRAVSGLQTPSHRGSSASRPRRPWLPASRGRAWAGAACRPKGLGVKEVPLGLPRTAQPPSPPAWPQLCSLIRDSTASERPHPASSPQGRAGGSSSPPSHPHPGPHGP